MKTNKQPYGTVLIKADYILEYLSLHTTPQRLNDIALKTNLTNSTALKILDTLTLIGYVQKDLETKKFSLGPSIIKYANRSLNQLDIKHTAQPHLEELQKNTEETVHLGIQDKTKVVRISKVESTKPIICLNSKIGDNIPLYCSAMGKSILADKSDDEIRAYIADNPLEKITENTITTEEGFFQEINRIRELGYAFDDSEHEQEVFCIGASITLNGNNFGAFSVSIPKYRITEDFIKIIIQKVQRCKANILADLQ
jgi:DNA-binding IclR family transcriptional regulator